ncbi:MAG: pentapeptide repeat-containing protein, partial [Candidatus Kapaibacterium sp.]
VNCNLSLANVTKTAFNEIHFTKCKLLGIDFSKCREFLLAFSFSDCILSSCSFANLKIGGTKFDNCVMHDAQFVNTELIGCTFEGCDLRDAFFDHSTLNKADFMNANNYAIDPEINRMKGAIFSRIGLEGLLMKYGMDIRS